MPIKELAERTGFSPTTLRYYEQVGVVAPPARTPSGQRRYALDTVERLAFVRRAKQLGCRLDEIVELLVAWDEGRCGPLQDRLRELVLERLATTEAQRRELSTFAADLRRTVEDLDRHRPDGPCDEECACLTAPSASSGRGEAIPVACTLSADGRRDQLVDWKAVGRHITNRDPVPGGMTVRFDETVDVVALAELAAREQRCCRFLTLVLRLAVDETTLTITGPPDASPVIDLLVG